MARPRTPLAIAKLTGADKNHPERYRDRSEPTISGKPIGKAPAYLPAPARKAWGAFSAELPWLIYEDRAILEAASLLRAAIMSGDTGDRPAAYFTALRLALSSLGATPVDRAKVAVEKKLEHENPFAAFDRAH